MTITVTRGSDKEPVIDEAARMLWLSKLHPLIVIAIGANEVDAQQRGIDRTIRPDREDKTELEAKYGPRAAQ